MVSSCVTSLIRMSHICSDEKKLTGDGIEACKDEISWIKHWQKFYSYESVLNFRELDPDRSLQLDLLCHTYCGRQGRCQPCHRCCQFQTCHKWGFLLSCPLRCRGQECPGLYGISRTGRSFQEICQE